MKGSSCLILFTCLFGAQALLYDRFHDVVWKKPILLDELTGKLFIQDDNCLYRILTSGLWTGVDGMKHVRGIRDLTDCPTCIVIRDVGLDSVRDWILDGRKIFCTEDMLKTMKLVGFTEGLITDGLLNHLLKTKMYDDLDVLRTYGDFDVMGRGVCNDKKIFLTKDIFKHVNKLIDVNDLDTFDPIVNERKLLAHRGLVDDIESDILRKKLWNRADVLDKPIDFVDKRIKFDAKKLMNGREDMMPLDYYTTPIKTWNTVGLDDIRTRYMMDDVNRVDLMRKLLFGGKKRFITKDDILDTDTRRFF